MNSKGIIAIVVVVILIAAGVGIGVFVANKNNDGNLPIDKVKDTVVAGDYIKMNASTISERSEPTTTDSFLGEIYYTGGGVLEEKDFIVKFDNKEYKCNVYVDEYIEGTFETVYAIADSGFILKRVIESYGLSMTYTAESTSMDVSKSMSDQKLIDGSTITYDLNQDVEGLKVPGVYILTYSHDKDGNEVKTVKMQSVAEIDMKVTKVEGDYVYIEGGNPIPVASFRENVSLKDWEAQQKAQGNELIRGEKKTEVQKTPFGDRNVTVENITVKTSYGSTDYVLTYGSEGFLYSTETISAGYYITIMSVKDTSLRV